MSAFKRSGLSLLLLCVMGNAKVLETGNAKTVWKGYSVLGNGHITAVYSDDPRISAVTHSEGLQHLYYKNYTADYVASTTFRAEDSGVQAGRAPTVGMKNFFTAQTNTSVPNGVSQTVLCFVHPEDAVVLKISEAGSAAGSPLHFEALLRKVMQTDHTITLDSFRTVNNVAIARWSNGTVLAIASRSAMDKTTVNEATVSITGALNGPEPQAQVLIVPADSPDKAFAQIESLRKEPDLEATAGQYWNAWMNAGRLPHLKGSQAEAAAYLESYKRNLYCVKASNLKGEIPADITGQFVTNGMPQLYPRDAMMCARVLLLTGHADEARQVIEFWARPGVPMKSPGEWYARYDARGKAVDGGSGARYDEPEWDANGYYIYLLDEYHRSNGVWLAPPQMLYRLADFLVSHLSSNGLLEEGGIVEWTGYLPATNMICAAALKTASSVAREKGNSDRASRYATAAAKISAGLPEMFDKTRQTYGDVRSLGVKGADGESLAGGSEQKLYLWDTTANVGVIWGYPNHRELELSNLFYDKNTVKMGGGMQYFDSPDPGLANYGHGTFFFTTAAASEYESLSGNNARAKSFIDWMMRNANSYGLMPEHLLPNGSDCSPASPLSWCCAEFAAALLLWSES